MVFVRKIVLDVLKPHQPNALELSMAIAKEGADYNLRLTVLEVDENTERYRWKLLEEQLTSNRLDPPLANWEGRFTVLTLWKCSRTLMRVKSSCIG